MKVSSAFENIPFLRVIEPRSNDNKSLSDLRRWLAGEDLLSYFDTCGAILFRNFQIENPEQFNLLLKAANIESSRYIAGNNPRHAVMENVYLSTAYPPEWNISLHSEMSHLSFFPKHIALFCKTPSEKGTGLTPLALNKDILSKVPTAITDKMEKYGIEYIQKMRTKDDKYGFGRSWQEVFETEEPSDVENYCKENGIKIRWENSNAIVNHLRFPTIVHPRLNIKLWFNQAEQWHYTNLSKEVQSFLKLKIGMDKIPHHARYGNGEEFEPLDLEKIRSVYLDCSRRFQWQSGDVLIIDNLQMAHGRDPYKGQREVFFAMGRS